MRYALLSSVPPPVLPLHLQLRSLSHQRGPFRLTGRPGLSLNCHFRVSRGCPLPDQCHAHKLLPSFKMALTFRFSASSSVKAYPRRLPNPLAPLPPPTPSTGGAPSQPVEDVGSDQLLQCKRFISGIMPLVIAILTGRQRVGCITR